MIFPSLPIVTGSRKNVLFYSVIFDGIPDCFNKINKQLFFCPLRYMYMYIRYLIKIFGVFLSAPDLATEQLNFCYKIEMNKSMCNIRNPNVSFLGCYCHVLVLLSERTKMFLNKFSLSI